ncbi:ARM repeat-containing protein [Metschnikowia bicuspidata]|uniref:ARM repeat-containing protein n=1 Tax=Metschnikowia bicuspidata TaxID=27322 RepID=A0A4P9ZAJ7_9ASCO|nr:ARM repeat-containing protein [Metschnikowia bicuspidata]
MTKKSLVGSYTAPPSALESEGDSPEPPPPTVSKSDYQNQKYNRIIDMALIQSYKERMDANKSQGRADDASGEERENGRASKRRKSASHEKCVQFVASTEDGEAVKEPASAHTALVETADDTEKSQSSSKPDPVAAELQVAVVNLPTYNGIALTDRVLDAILPAGFVPAAVPKELALHNVEPDHYVVPLRTSTAHTINDTLPEYEGIMMRREDVRYFATLVNVSLDDIVDGEERRKYRAMDLVFRIKNGPPAVRKKAMRSIAAGARELGAGAVFGVVLPLMLEPSLDVGDRYIVTKLLGRVVYQLQGAVRPYTYQLVTALAPALIDEDATLRLETRDVIAAVARAAGFANIVAALRPDLNHADEYVRNVTARVFAVVAGALGLGTVLPFVKAAIRSQRSWHARHTGIRVVHHVCVMLSGTQVLPHLAQLVDVLQPGLTDELVQVRSASASTVALLAECVAPYGADAFERMVEPAWNGLKTHRGRSLAAFVRCMGALIALLAASADHADHANYYTRELMGVVTREFGSPDEDMRRAVLRALVAMPISPALFPDYRRTMLAPFFHSFWTRRTALDASAVAWLVVECTAQIAGKLDVSAVMERLAPLARDANEGLRRMACDAVARTLTHCTDAAVLLDRDFDARLLDAVLYAFQHQKLPHALYLAAFGTICKTLGSRVQPHVMGILSTVLFRLKHSEVAVRQQAADLLAAVADTVYMCTRADPAVMRKLVLFLYELLGEVYPDALGSVLGALYACLNALDRSAFATLDNPLPNVLLPTLTPILMNRHDKVQELCVRLVGLIARRNAETIHVKEWMRVCFDLLDMLKLTRRRIRVAANSTFGAIARTIGPQDVLVMLLNNLQMQERQIRVCTAVAIGIVADTCGPFTVLPALMNEYRYPDKNVQNGVLKAMSFLFEYLDGRTSRDYLFAVTPLLEDALTDRDQVHRQTAASTVRNLALNCYGLAHDLHHDVFVHLLNLVMPNVFETSPHVILRVLECLDALRIVLGPAVFMKYVWAGLFQAARKVRVPYWKLYNAAYIQSCDALVPCYPLLDGVPRGTARSYRVRELDMWL